MFINLYPKKSPLLFKEATNGRVPLLQCGVVNVRSRFDKENELKVYRILQQLPQLDPILDHSSFKGNEDPGLFEAFKLEASYIGIDLSYWNLVQSQLCKSVVGTLQWDTKPTEPGFSHSGKVLPGNQRGSLVSSSLRCLYRGDGAELSTILLDVWLIGF